MAAMSKLPCVSYAIAVWGTSQSSSSAWPLGELPTPNRDKRGANPTRSTPLPRFGGPSSPARTCVLAGGTWAMEGSSPIPLGLCPHWAGDQEGGPKGSLFPAGSLLIRSPLAAIPAPSLLRASPRDARSQGLPPLTQALGSTARPGHSARGFLPQAWNFLRALQPVTVRLLAHEPA